MIAGLFFNDVPHLTAVLYLPRLKKGRRVHLLVDTGSGHSIIHPAVANQLALDFVNDPKDQPRETVKGIGGEEEVWLEEAEITFRCKDGQPFPIQQQIWIAIPMGDNEHLQSLLGRDVLHAFRLLYSFPNRELTLGQP